MNVLVFSDSHGRTDKINEALERQISPPDAILFLGDGLRDIESADVGNIPVYSVCGNCDSYYDALFGDVADERLIVAGCKRILITHGHKYHVKSVLSVLLQRAKQKNADIVLFGHTHMPFEMMLGQDNEYGIELCKPMYVMNPGSIGSYPYSFGNIEIDRAGRVLLSHGALR